MLHNRDLRLLRAFARPRAEDDLRRRIRSINGVNVKNGEANCQYVNSFVCLAIRWHCSILVVRWREYLGEYRRLTTSSLQTIFGSRLYHAHVEQDLSTLFNILVSDQANLDDVTRASNRLFDQLILSSYSQFSAKDPYAPLDDQLKTCLIITASHIDALPTRRELLFTLTSAASLIHIARTLFVYMDADIERLKRSAFPDPDRCFQRYAQESLCPICASADADGNEPLCEDSCRFVMKTCLEQTNNPYVTFALVAQGYSNVIKQIQELIVELKVSCNESRLSKQTLPRL